MRRIVVAILLTASLLAACAKPTPAPLPPEDIVAQAVARMKSRNSFHFIIERTGAPAYIDTNNTLSLARAEGDFTVPDRAQGQARIIAPGIVASIKFISIGDQYWQTNPLTGRWEEFAPGTFFNPAMLFDSEVGLQPILETDLLDLQLTGNEELEEMPGQQLYAISGKLAGDRVAAMSWGLIGPGTMDIRLWIDPATFDLERIQIEEPASDGGESTRWQIDFLDFNKVVNILPPATAS